MVSVFFTGKGLKIFQQNRLKPLFFQEIYFVLSNLQ